MTLLSMALAIPLLAGLHASSVPADHAQRELRAELPLNPDDEKRQTMANFSAYLVCTCLFVEKSDEKTCRSDLLAGDDRIDIRPDIPSSIVRVINGRWTAVARFLAPKRGCRLD